MGYASKSDAERKQLNFWKSKEKAENVVHFDQNEASEIH